MFARRVSLVICVCADPNDNCLFRRCIRLSFNTADLRQSLKNLFSSAEMFSASGCSLIGAIRYLHGSSRRLMKWAEVSAVLRPFYLKVHPDMFMKFPDQQRTNEDSLKELNSYLESLTKHEVPTKRRLEFFMKKNGSDELSKLKINLQGKALLETLRYVLKTAGLPTDNVSATKMKVIMEDEFGYKEEDSLHWTMHPDDLASFRGPSRDQGLMSFLDENVEVAMERTRTAAPIIDEILRVESIITSKLGVISVAWECGWGVAHYRAGLLALLKLCEQHPDVATVLRGRKVSFGQWTGVSLEGHIVLSAGEVRESWLNFLKRLDEQLKFVEWVPHAEKQLSLVLRGIQVSHERLSHRTVASMYLVQVNKLTRCLQRWLWLNSYPPTLPEDLAAFTLVVEGDAGPLMVSPQGELIAPSSCPAQLFVDFLEQNLARTEQIMLRHSMSILEEEELRGQLIWKLGLRELSKDDTISSHRMADFYASCTTCGIKTGIPIKMQRLIQSIRYAAAINLPHAVQIYPVPASNFARILSSEAAKQKKTEFIRLIDEHGKGLGKMLKPDAESLAAKKHMSLIRVEDQQISQKTPLYQLVLPKAATTKLPKQSQSKKNEPPDGFSIT
ncbi:T-cell activation inhibitor, mitochondrial-like isoform X3 [Varroa destructor]|uniref:DUF4460 domain-containing protein n=1 Tax=Varroa destructor TaxID=109461 RepID=A0A7M7KMK8_VARDE|nr:T-cell activation inhibitor, mitochondrial-like isoform X3 [Varroa destructor]